MFPRDVALWAARAALAITFLSAVADRFGAWGSVKLPWVDWGDMTVFTQATAALNPWMPSWLVPAFAWGVTLLEIVLAAVLLLLPNHRWPAAASALLLLCFGVAMAVFLHPKEPLNYSVFTASACAFLLYAFIDSRQVTSLVSPKDKAKFRQ